MIYNVGICDVNNCEILDNDGKLSKCYNTWHDMLRRCYSDGYQTYKDCSVCDEWKFYSVFREWFYDNYYTVDDEEMNLDKDLLVKNNKIYCPEKCCFIPKTINIMLTKSNKTRGKLPIGVSLSGNKYRVRCGGVYCGTFETTNSAFLAYKTQKELQLKDIADKYRIHIPSNVYDALISYCVEISD